MVLAQYDPQYKIIEYRYDKQLRRDVLLRVFSRLSKETQIILKARYLGKTAKECSRLVGHKVRFGYFRHREAEREFVNLISQDRNLREIRGCGIEIMDEVCRLELEEKNT